MWFIDVNCVHIKLFNDFVTCLFWFTVRRLPCSVKRGRIFIGSENEVFCGKPYSRDKMMDVILILEPICTAMHEWYHNCFSCIPLMLLSRHHPQEIISHWILWLSVVTTICFIMMYCSIQWAICVDIHSRTLISIPATHTNICIYFLLFFRWMHFHLPFLQLLSHLIISQCNCSFQKLQQMSTHSLYPHAHLKVLHRPSCSQ